MLEAAAILLFGCLTPLFSVWMLQRAERWVRQGVQAAIRRHIDLLPFVHGIPDVRYVEPIGHHIGDANCRFNAHSIHLRCAVNPLGPCQGCRSFEPTRGDRLS